MNLENYQIHLSIYNIKRLVYNTNNNDNNDKCVFYNQVQKYILNKTSSIFMSFIEAFKWRVYFDNIGSQFARLFTKDL